MSKEYISGDRLQQTHDNIVQAPILEGSAEYLIGIKDGKLYRITPDNAFVVQESSGETDVEG